MDGGHPEQTGAQSRAWRHDLWWGGRADEGREAPVITAAVRLIRKPWLPGPLRWLLGSMCFVRVMNLPTRAGVEESCGC